MNYYDINKEEVRRVSEEELWAAIKLFSETNDVDAEFTIVNYVLTEFLDKGKEQITEEELNDRFSILVTDGTLTNLVQKGFLNTSFDENGEITYQVNESGIDYLERLENGNV